LPFLNLDLALHKGPALGQQEKVPEMGGEKGRIWFESKGNQLLVFYVGKLSHGTYYSQLLEWIALNSNCPKMVKYEKRPSLQIHIHIFPAPLLASVLIKLIILIYFKLVFIPF
jgi:hypothetical protein